MKLPHITMPKHTKLCAAQTASINKAGMREAIGKNESGGINQRWNQPDICRISGTEDQRGFRMLEVG